MQKGIAQSTIQTSYTTKSKHSINKTILDVGAEYKKTSKKQKKSIFHVHLSHTN